MSPRSREWRIWRMVCCIRVRQNCFKGQEIQCNDGLNNKEASYLKSPRRQSRVDMTVLQSSETWPYTSCCHPSQAPST